VYIPDEGGQRKHFMTRLASTAVLLQEPGDSESTETLENVVLVQLAGNRESRLIEHICHTAGTTNLGIVSRTIRMSLTPE